MEDAFSGDKQNGEQTSSDDTLQLCPSQLANAQPHVESTNESSDLQLKVIWAGKTHFSNDDYQDQSIDSPSRLKSGAQAAENISDSMKPIVKPKTELKNDPKPRQLISDVQNKTNEDSNPSDSDERLSEPETSEEKMHIKFELKDSSSDVDQFKAERMLASEEQLNTLDESYRLIDKIDMDTPIDEGRPQLPGRPSIGERLLELLTDGNKWDVKIYIGGFKFYCHLCVLQVYSPYCRQYKMEETCVIRLPVHKVTAQAFHIIYNWMLHDRPPLRKRYSNRCLLELYSSAKFLGITELIDAVWNTLDIIKNENEAFTLMPSMNYVDGETFDFLCFSRISRFFLTLVASLEFAEMDESYVCRLLSSHNLGVNSEIEIFYSAVRWLSYKWPRRQSCVPNLMKYVRFGLISPVFLRSLQNEQRTQVMQYIAQCPSVQEQITKAFIYVSAELYCKDPQKTLPFQLPEYDVPDQRRWLYDKNCAYHHDLKCSQRQFFTYEQFLTYLESLHETGPDYWRKLEYIVKPVNCCARTLTE